MRTFGFQPGNASANLAETTTLKLKTIEMSSKNKSKYKYPKMDNTDRRSPLQYKMFTKGMKQELSELLDQFLSPNDMNDWSYRYSGNRNFRISSRSLSICYQFLGDRDDEEKAYYATLFTFSDSEYTIHALTGEDHRAPVSGVKNHIQSMLLGMGVEPVSDGDKFIRSQSKRYSRCEVIGDSVKPAIKRVIASVDLPKYQILTKPHSLSYSEESGNVKFNYRGRWQVMKVGKGVKKFFKLWGIDLDDNTVKDLANRISSPLLGYQFRVVEGSDIDKYYLEQQYDDSEETGSLESSCMRYSVCVDEDYFEIYKDNAKMLILVNDETDLIIGRAILWDNVTLDECQDLESGDEEVGSTIKFMDRIYSAESTYPKFKDWAKNNGYWRKRYQSYSSPTTFVSPVSSTVKSAVISVGICLDNYDMVPYMDTLNSGDDYRTSNDEDYGPYRSCETDGSLMNRDSDDDGCDY